MADKQKQGGLALLKVVCSYSLNASEYWKLGKKRKKNNGLTRVFCSFLGNNILVISDSIASRKEKMYDTVKMNISGFS